MSVKKRVARGVALMDERRPGWDRRIRLDQLDIGGRSTCIVGQVFGHFDEETINGKLGISIFSTPRYGFAGCWHHLGETRHTRDWDELTVEWARVILVRRQEQAAERFEQEHRRLLRSERRELARNR